MMEEYDLTKEDWDSIIEVGQFEGQKDPVTSIPSKVCTYTCSPLILVQECLLIEKCSAC